MTTISITRTDSEQRFINDILGESIASVQSFENLRDAACLATSRKVLVDMLGEFDEFCSEHDIKYFLFAETLKGVIAYADFLPGKANVLIGMMRGEYQKFLAEYRSFMGVENRTPYGLWDFCELHDKFNKKVRRRMPRLCATKPTVVTFEDKVVFDKQSLPMTVQPFAEISIFDEVPDDFFTRKKFYRQMKRRNNVYNNIIRAREILFARKNPDLDDDQLISRMSRMGMLRALGYSILPLRLVASTLWRKAAKYKGEGTECVARVMGSRSKTVLAEDLGECSYRSFAGIEVRCPDNPSSWATEPVLEATEELRRLQNDAKEIVKEIDRVCSEMGIQYFACGGTMLGYVRHGGFIPWDDDIDVGMLREDYERFKKEAHRYIDANRFFLQTRDTDPNIPYLFSKIRLNGSEYITEYNKDRDFHKGICVDIFPFDYIPQERNLQEAFKREVRSVEKAHNRIVNRQYPEISKKSEPPKRNLDWMIAQVIGRLLARHYWNKSLQDTQSAYEAVVTRHNECAQDEGLEYVACFVPSYTMAKVSDLFPAQRVCFDGIEINIPAHPEIFLRMQYGDYMLLPYPHQRMGHDLLLWSDEDGVGGGRLADA